MKNNKLFIRIIIMLVLFVGTYNLKAQENKLFNEYLHTAFREVKPNDNLVLYSTFLDSTKYNRGISYGKYKYQQFIPIEMGHVAADTFIVPSFMFTNNDFYVTFFEFITEDEKIFKNNGAYYYFVFYDKEGEIINNYKLLSGTDQQGFKDGVNYASKLFISKDKIKYLLYGPYRVPEMEANCREVLYEITKDGRLEILSEHNYKAKKKDPWNW
jgi:hypothetical protein